MGSDHGQDFLWVVAKNYSCGNRQVHRMEISNAEHHSEKFAEMFRTIFEPFGGLECFFSSNGTPFISINSLRQNVSLHHYSSSSEIKQDW